MRRFLRLCVLILVGVISTIASAQTGTSQGESSAHERKAKIEGVVRDIACPIQNLEATATHVSMKCLRACAKGGSPLAILTNDGELYMPFSKKMPNEHQRQMLAPSLGNSVRPVALSIKIKECTQV